MFLHKQKSIRSLTRSRLLFLLITCAYGGFAYDDYVQQRATTTTNNNNGSSSNNLCATTITITTNILFNEKTSKTKGLYGSRKRKPFAESFRVGFFSVYMYVCVCACVYKCICRPVCEVVEVIEKHCPRQQVEKSHQYLFIFSLRPQGIFARYVHVLYTYACSIYIYIYIYR